MPSKPSATAPITSPHCADALQWGELRSAPTMAGHTHHTNKLKIGSILVLDNLEGQGKLLRVLCQKTGLYEEDQSPAPVWNGEFWDFGV